MQHGSAKNRNKKKNSDIFEKRRNTWEKHGETHGEASNDQLVLVLKESKNHRRAKGEPQEFVSHSTNICHGKHVKTISQYTKKNVHLLSTNGRSFHPLC